MRCRKASAARQVRPIFPVFQWISGATRTMWRSIWWLLLCRRFLLNFVVNKQADCFRPVGSRLRVQCSKAKRKRYCSLFWQKCGISWNDTVLQTRRRPSHFYKIGLGLIQPGTRHRRTSVEPWTYQPRLKFLTAVRTIEKSFVDRIAAESAQQPGLFLIGGLVPYELIFCSVTTLAYSERLAFFDSHYRNEKYA